MEAAKPRRFTDHVNVHGLQQILARRTRRQVQLREPRPGPFRVPSGRSPDPSPSGRPFAARDRLCEMLMGDVGV
jgi:hypothetical protein